MAVLEKRSVDVENWREMVALRVLLKMSLTHWAKDNYIFRGAK